MANLRLYRKIYSIDVSGNYSLITPLSLFVNSYIADSINLIESPIVINESMGIYYVDLNPLLYSYDLTYELQWNIQYDIFSPVKILSTRFKLNPYNLGGNGLEIEIFNKNSVEIELSNKPIEIEITK